MYFKRANCLVLLGDGTRVKSLLYIIEYGSTDGSSLVLYVHSRFDDCSIILATSIYAVTVIFHLYCPYAYPNYKRDMLLANYTIKLVYVFICTVWLYPKRRDNFVARLGSPSITLQCYLKKSQRHQIWCSIHNHYYVDPLFLSLTPSDYQDRVLVVNTISDELSFFILFINHIIIFWYCRMGWIGWRMM